MTVTNNKSNSHNAAEERFKPDNERGKWSTKWDFYIASIANSFGFRNIASAGLDVIMESGAFLLIPSLISIALIIIPVFFIRSAIGQFTSTGVISIFRVAPLFKGIGYTVVVLTIISSTTYSITTALELLYMYSSIQINLPWMSCNNSWNTPDCKEEFNSTNLRRQSNSSYQPHSTSEYYYALTKTSQDDESTFSWAVFAAILLLWIGVSLVLHYGIKGIEKLIRYTTIIPFSILLLLILRCLFLPGAWQGLGYYFKPDFKRLGSSRLWITTPYFTTYLYGSGWPSISTLASYNDLKMDVQKYSIVLSFCTFGLTIISTLWVYTILGFLGGQIGDEAISYYNESYFPFVLFPYFASRIEASQFWALLFFVMLFLFEINSTVIQTFTILTALFDEFPVLRYYKKYISFGTCGTLFLLSIMYATGNGTDIAIALGLAIFVAQLILCFFELMTYVWAYGRVRFLSDIEFMQDKPFAPWKFYVLRFVTPAIIFLITPIILVGVFTVTSYTRAVERIIEVLPFIVIIAFAVYKLVTSTGSLSERFKKNVTPTDWYPVDGSWRMKYEAKFGKSDTTHQLVDMHA